MKRIALLLLLPPTAACSSGAVEPPPGLPTETRVTSVAAAPADAWVLDLAGAAEAGQGVVTVTGTLVAHCTAGLAGRGDVRGVFSLELDVRPGRRPCDGAPGLRTFGFQATVRDVPPGTYRFILGRNHFDGARESFVSLGSLPDVVVR